MDQERIQVRAHAKVNLTLDVLGRRPDGYHAVRMVMQPLELYDLVTITPDEGLTVTCPGVPDGEINLAFRAAQLLQAHAGPAGTGGARIVIDKRIPIAAGLAGGSADAAAVLQGLNSLWRLGLPPAELARLGGRLGSDIPYCLLSRTALAEGRGEIITPLSPAPRILVVLATPALRWPGPKTATVYGALRLAEVTQRPDTAGLLAALEKADVDGIAGRLCNVLEPVAASIKPVIRALRAALQGAGAWGVAMTGAGPTVYALARSRREAEDLAGAARRFTEQVTITAFLVGADTAAAGTGGAGRA